MKKLSWLSFLFLLAAAFACQEDRVLQETEEGVTAPSENQKAGKGGARLTTENGINCDEGDLFPLMVGDMETGTAEIWLNADNIYVDYDLSAGEWYLLEVGAYAGDCNAIPDDPLDYPYYKFYDPESGVETRTHSFEIPLANLPDCGCLSVMATVARYNPSTSQLESSRVLVDIEYCNCDEPEEPEDPDDENLRTQTPGGWGAAPNGNNAGAYLHANFDEAFPGGLVVGCDYTITLTSAQAVTGFLPQGGPPAALTMSYVNPIRSPKTTNNPKSVLAGHVVALTLSVTFDAWDADFGDSGTQLANAVVTTGNFEGWTVAGVLAEAEKVLGGCDSDYSASAMTHVLTSINESFIDGTTNTGFLMNGI